MEEMTLDELGRMVAEGFSAVDHRFEALEERIEEVRTELQEEMRSGFREVHARIDQLVSLHEDHSRRIKDLELKTA